MADENFDIMKPISADLDIEKTMFDDQPVTAPAMTEMTESQQRTDANYGYVTSEEAQLFGAFSEESSSACDSSVLNAQPPVSDNRFIQSIINEAADMPSEVRSAMAKLNEERKGEWLPKLSVRVNGREVYGKKKNCAIMVIGAVFLILISVVLFAFLSD